MKGIRFYETEIVPKSPGFKSASFEAVEGVMVEFFFYREECEDMIFKRGKIRNERFIGYVIQARISEAMPEKLHRFNNLKFFFNSKNFAAENEEMIVSRLLDIYLSVLRIELKKQ